MEVWKIVFHSISFWHLPYSVPNFLFHSIPFHFPFHSIPCPGCRFFTIIISDYLLHFTPTVVASLKIWKRLSLKKLLPLLAPFQQFRFRVRFRFQPVSSKCFCFRLHKKLTASAYPKN